MAHEDLMRELPGGVERVPVEGPFFIQDNSPIQLKFPDSGKTCFSVIALTPVIVTCGGNGKESATDLASRLNQVWNEWIEESKISR